MAQLQRESLDAVISAARIEFPDFELVAPDGRLELHQDLLAVDRLRLELPPGQHLHLQSVGITADGVDDVAAVATAAVSSGHEGFGDGVDLARLLDFDAPSGPAVHTGEDEPSWLELSFAHPLDISAIRLRNVSGLSSVQARGIRVLAGAADNDLTVVYDGTERAAELDRELATLASPEHYGGEAGDLIQALLPVISNTLRGDYRAGRIALEKVTLLSEETARLYKLAINEMVLRERSREWTVHGAKRSFRFWSEQEKLDYVELAVTIAAELKQLTPHTCFGFGATLAVVRDGDLIPHDDDLDLIVGFEPAEAANLPQGLRRIERFLRQRGYTVSGAHAAHRQVRVAAGPPVDVFVGLFEGDTISWYPGTRGSLNRQLMYPTSTGQLLGIECPLPHDPPGYLERVYGPDWQQPNPDFAHSWNRASYADLTRRPAGAAKKTAAKTTAPNQTAAARQRRTPLSWQQRARRRLRRYAAAVVPAQIRSSRRARQNQR
jgi:hypothetical protein